MGMAGPCRRCEPGVSKRQRDCTECGAPVGYKARTLCCRCTRRATEAAARRPCPDCGRDRVLNAGTGRCVLCSRRCTQCAAPVRSAGVALCKTCRRRAAAAAAKSLCPRCGRLGIIGEVTGWCGTCSRPRPSGKPPRTCTQCARSTTHPVNGLCSACWQRDPQRPRVRAEHLLDDLDHVPSWLPDLLEAVIVVYSPGRAAVVMGQLHRLLDSDGRQPPQHLLNRACRPGRSIGPLARAMQDYFVRHHLAEPIDHAGQLAIARRGRRVDAVPHPLRPAVAAFSAWLLTANNRARTAGTAPRANSTIDHALATMRDFARYLTAHGKNDWSLTHHGDLEAFLATRGVGHRPRTLTVLKQFFRWARAHKVILIDPAAELRIRQHRGFTGRTISLEQQRALYRRWASSDDHVHPHEAFIGLLALLHGASSAEARGLTTADIDTVRQTVNLGNRPHSTVLDPATWHALEDALQHRAALHTTNPHLIVTRGTKADSRPASSAYLSHILDPVGLSPHRLRVTRLAELVNTTDPKLVASAYGMRPVGVIDYLADHVDQPRLPDGH